MPDHISRDDLHHLMTNGQPPDPRGSARRRRTTPTPTFPAPSTSPQATSTDWRRRCCPTGRRRSSCTAPAQAPAATPSRSASKQLGYAAVAVYRGGKEDWVEHGLPLERLDTDGE